MLADPIFEGLMRDGIIFDGLMLGGLMFDGLISMV